MPKTKRRTTTTYGGSVNWGQVEGAPARTELAYGSLNQQLHNTFNTTSPTSSNVLPVPAMFKGGKRSRSTTRCTRSSQCRCRRCRRSSRRSRSGRSGRSRSGRSRSRRSRTIRGGAASLLSAVSVPLTLLGLQRVASSRHAKK